MTLQDSKKSSNLFLLALSKTPGLDLFKNIILFSSKQDKYVSQNSAFMEKDANIVYDEMAENLSKSISNEKITKVEVHFGDKTKSIFCENRHLDFIDNPYFVKMLCYTFPGLFF